jgi:hypothetical protein
MLDLRAARLVEVVFGEFMPTTAETLWWAFLCVRPAPFFSLRRGTSRRRRVMCHVAPANVVCAALTTVWRIVAPS